jgi:hypothetical protein
MEKSSARRDGLYVMLLGTVFFLLFGFVLMNTGRVPLLDFRTAYYSGLSLIQHLDPYNESDVAPLYAERHENHLVSDRDQQVITRNIYLPPAFAFTVPLALLPFKLGESLWFLLILCSFVLGTFLMASAAGEHAPLLAAGLLAFCLANSGSLLFFGNPAGFVVPFCVIAAWCFIRQRFTLAGIACLMVSLAFKPHDAGFVWLYFLLAGGIYRRRALATLAYLAALGIPALAWISHIAPAWPREIAANLQVFSAPGGMNDPSGGHGSLVLTNLQCITSFFWPDPHSYNLAGYLVCAPLLLVWAFLTLRSRPTAPSAWLALAAIAPLTMLPVYHRQYDAKLILLAVPACALLWSRRGALGWAAALVTTIAFVLNGDLPWVVFLAVLNHLHLSLAGSSGRILTAVWDFPVPLSLLAMSIFYLAAFARQVWGAQLLEEEPESIENTTPHPVAG